MIHTDIITDITQFWDWLCGTDKAFVEYSEKTLAAKMHSE
jgi:hypothetical protein